MKLETRLTVLLGSLLAVFLAALCGLHAVQRRGTNALRSDIAADKTRNLARLVELDGSPLERFVADFTQWDELCDFVARPDEKWAEVNVQQTLAMWKFHAAWVFDLEGRVIHRTLRPPFEVGDLSDFPSTELRAALCRATPGHFYADTPRGLLEVRTSPIHPSDDARLSEPPRGWVFAARLWTADTLTQLAGLADSTLTLVPASASLEAPDAATIGVRHPLPDWQGRPLHSLTLRHSSALLAQMIEYDSNELLFYLLSGCAFMAVTGWFLHRWVRLPLRTIGESLLHSDPARVAPLLHRNDEFAHIATMIRTAGEQRLALRREVADRTYAVQGLRHAIAERSRLGRDLHDGVIQSIYAVGLTLQGLSPALPPASAEAARRLTTCVDALNRVIAELRRHIAGLETDPTPKASLTADLQRLVEELQPVRAVDYRVDLDPLVAAAIPPDSIAQLLLIAREALSNALRHSQAGRIALRLATENGEAVFTIEDNGCGFEVGPATHRGHGLDNMTRRAEEIGAVLLIDSGAGRGTRLRVELPAEAAQPLPPES
jgi:signal transduction histidine kinase